MLFFSYQTFWRLFGSNTAHSQSLKVQDHHELMFWNILWMTDGATVSGSGVGKTFQTFKFSSCRSNLKKHEIYAPQTFGAIAYNQCNLAKDSLTISLIVSQRELRDTKSLRIVHIREIVSNFNHSTSCAELFSLHKISLSDLYMVTSWKSLLSTIVISFLSSVLAAH